MTKRARPTPLAVRLRARTGLAPLIGVSLALHAAIAAGFIMMPRPRTNPPPPPIVVELVEEADRLENARRIEAQVAAAGDPLAPQRPAADAMNPGPARDERIAAEATRPADALPALPRPTQSLASPASLAPARPATEPGISVVEAARADTIVIAEVQRPESVIEATTEIPATQTASTAILAPPAAAASPNPDGAQPLRPAAQAASQPVRPAAQAAALAAPGTTMLVARAPDGDEPQDEAATAPSYSDDNLGNEPPAYPFAARVRGIEGRVVLLVRVKLTGSAETVEVKSTSGSRLLDNAAIKAVSAWRFRPAQRGGAPIPGLAEVPVTFRLTD